MATWRHSTFNVRNNAELAHLINRRYLICSLTQTLSKSITKFKQGVTLTGRNTTGPPRAAPDELHCAVECYRRRQTTTDDDDRRTANKTILAPALCVGGPVIIRQNYN